MFVLEVLENGNWRRVKQGRKHELEKLKRRTDDVNLSLEKLGATVGSLVQTRVRKLK